MIDLGLKGKSVLVFASSKGLGKASAHAYAKAGANVMLTSRTLEHVKDAADEISRDAEGLVAYQVCDVSVKADIENVVRETSERFGGIDVLVCNAGGPPPGDFASVTEEDFEWAFQLTLMSVVRGIKAAYPYLKTAKGRIVIITSSSMKEPVNGLLLSNINRMGLVGLNKSLAHEFAPDGVLINAVGPGRIDTERVQSLDEINAKKQGISPDDMKNQNETAIPIGRYGQPDEFGNTVLFLGSGLNTYMTGQHFLIDGGLTKAY
ncbi:SDR family oxidoreductase [Salisediminibacterium beveridgei]|uniref:3-oxoacyl-[acyl-carrier protein] reductase n=1 Tax=Salisediminibacterium beveridgei TaxID=632773 RepID=A0A1D7QXP3_9BACI|nr:SDR family oxidoreductase [Salisediminibacterium beveridgei]AOM83728.1 3-oxoacyl-[acyl-carrier protein] reductase [Salisediminibacterium beveridgei]